MAITCDRPEDALSPLTAQKASESVAFLGILSALAVPLFPAARGREQPRGVPYVDFRDRRKFVSDQHVEFFMSAAVLIGAMLEQEGRAQAVRAQLREAQSHCMDARRTPPLEDLLAAPSLRALRSEIESAVAGDSPILILGESGTARLSSRNRSRRRAGAGPSCAPCSERATTARVDRTSGARAAILPITGKRFIRPPWSGRQRHSSGAEVANRPLANQ